MGRRLTLIAGSGALVPIVAHAARARGDQLQLLDLVGRSDVEADVVSRVQLGDVGQIVAAIRGFRTTHLVLAGAVRLSDADRERIAQAFGFVGRLARSLGDLGLAAAGLVYCHLIGVRLIGAHDLAPELLAPLGPIAGPALGPATLAAASVALRAARRIGRFDLGQSVVFSGRRAIAAEDAGGTDQLLERVATLRAAGLAGDGRGPLILAKALKPRQPRFVDLPTIGPATLRNAAAAGISVIAVQAGATLVLERPELVELAGVLGISVVGAKAGNG